MQISKYDYAVPRYTSFPTAVQFHVGISPTVVAARLAGLPRHEPLSLYTHIPFCHQLCFYCGCNTTVTPNYDRIESYVELLLHEITLAGRHIPKGLKVNRIHFGGGSPNYARVEDLARILDAYRELFDCSEAQIDMECDPRLFSEEKIAGLADLGVERISLGIQDFDPMVQAAINREQPFEKVEKEVATLRKAGIQKINFDLIIGLPEQTLGTVKDTLEKTISLDPARVSVFPYAHVPWMMKHQRVLEQYDMPDTGLRYDMANMVEQTLKDAGYVHIGIDHFAKPDDPLTQAMEGGTLRRNFQGYSADPSDTILGFGHSAISQFRDAYTQNTSDARQYRQLIRANISPVSRGLVLSRDDMARRSLIKKLMCTFRVDYADHPEINIPYGALAPLTADGIITMDDDGLTVTDEGRRLTRIVAACFDPYFEHEAGRHAKAI